MIFISSADKLPSSAVSENGVKVGADMIRVFWGGGDGSVGTGIISVNMESSSG
eukprot:COSAG02_NODE_876_length_16272_cov_138.802510_6_plen_53_part_00